MQADRFTIKSQEALQAAIGLAASRNQPQVLPEHLLNVLLEQDDSLVPGLLRKVGVECQSWEWHSSTAAQHRDARRRGILRMRGWEIVDVWWSDLRSPDRGAVGSVHAGGYA